MCCCVYQRCITQKCIPSKGARKNIIVARASCSACDAWSTTGRLDVLEHRSSRAVGTSPGRRTCTTDERKRRRGTKTSRYHGPYWNRSQTTSPSECAQSTGTQSKLWSSLWRAACESPAPRHSETLCCALSAWRPRTCAGCPRAAPGNREPCRP